MNKALEVATAPLRAVGSGVKAVAAAISANIILPGLRAQWPWGWGQLTDSYAYSQKIGDGRDTSILSSTVDWICRAFPEAPVKVMTGRRADEEDAPDHPLAALLEQPNPFYDGVLLWNGTLPDLLFDGNAYWLKGRAGSGRPIQLWWVPSMLINPVGPNDGSDYITHYDYRPNGIPIAVDPADVVHFRYGLDPRNIRKGLSPIHAQLREAYTDEEAGMFTATVLRNLALPGLVLSPSDPRGMSDKQAEHLKQNVIAKFSGERRGEPLVSMGALDVKPVGWSPTEMDLANIRHIPEERLTASLHIPSAIVGFGSGLERATYSNVETLKGEAWNNGIIPLHRLLIAALRTQLVPDFGDRTMLRVTFDTSHVKALQEEVTTLWERTDRAVRGGWLTVGRAKALIGEEHGPEDEYYLRPITVSVTPGPGFSGLPPAPEPPAPRITLGAAPPDVSETVPPDDTAPAPTPIRRSVVQAASRNGHAGGGEGRALGATHRPPPDGGAMTAVQRKATLTSAQRELHGKLEAAKQEREKEFADELDTYFTRLRRGATAVIDGKAWSAGESKTYDFSEDDFFDEEDERALGDIFAANVTDTAGKVTEAVEQVYPQLSSLGTPTTAALARAARSRARNVLEVTRQAIGEYIAVGNERGYSTAQLANGVPADDFRGIRSLVEETYAGRATAIARTELGYAANGSAAARYRASKIEEVDIMDGDEDEECSSVDGTRQSLDWFDDNPLGHPNCIRAGLPVVE